MTRPWTRGEELALVAFRLWGAENAEEIGIAIGRSRNAISERMTQKSWRTNGWREKAWDFLHTAPPFVVRRI
jgi:hypothetical protein